MKFALNLAEDDRILSACVVLPNGNYDGMPIVDNLPADVAAGEESISNYRYINEQYVYNPIPRDPDPEPIPSVWDELDAAYQEGVDSV